MYFYICGDYGNTFSQKEIEISFSRRLTSSMSVIISDIALKDSVLSWQECVLQKTNGDSSKGNIKQTVCWQTLLKR